MGKVARFPSIEVVPKWEQKSFEVNSKHFMLLQKFGRRGINHNKKSKNSCYRNSKCSNDDNSSHDDDDDNDDTK